MPIFFLHVHYGDQIASDEEGIERKDLREAREEALKGIRSLLAADILEGRASLEGRIVIMNEANHVVSTVPFSEAVTITQS